MLDHLFPQSTCSKWNLFSLHLAYWVPFNTLASFFFFEFILTLKVIKADGNMLHSNYALWIVANISKILWKTCLVGPSIYLFICLLKLGGKKNCPLIKAPFFFKIQTYTSRVQNLGKRRVKDLKKIFNKLTN